MERLKKSYRLWNLIELPHLSVPGRPGARPAGTVLLIAAAAFGGPASAADCPAGPTPGISVDTVEQPVRLEEDRTIEELRAKADAASLPADEALRPAGLYTAGLAHEMTATFAVRSRPGGPACVSVESVRISLSLTEPVIWLAREAAAQACSRQAVLEHERRHHAIDRAVQKELARALRAELEAWAAQLEPVRAADGEAGQARLQEELERRVRRVSATWERERRQRQQAIDTPAEYARVSAACRD